MSEKYAVIGKLENVSTYNVIAVIQFLKYDRRYEKVIATSPQIPARSFARRFLLRHFLFFNPVPCIILLSFDANEFFPFGEWFREGNSWGRILRKSISFAENLVPERRAGRQLKPYEGTKWGRGPGPFCFSLAYGVSRKMRQVVIATHCSGIQIHNFWQRFRCSYYLMLWWNMWLHRK